MKKNMTGKEIELAKRFKYMLNDVLKGINGDGSMSSVKVDLDKMKLTVEWDLFEDPDCDPPYGFIPY